MAKRKIKTERKKNLPKSNQFSSEEKILLPKNPDHKMDEKNLPGSAILCFMLPMLLSLPGNGAKNLTGQVLYLSKCTDHLQQR